jgi:AcrR family transcriptional regulator
MLRRDNATRRRILRVALKHFAESGYPGASVQKIVDEARITKPTLYYYFRSKAGLYQALIDRAYDERHQLMLQAVEGKMTLSDQLVEMFGALFEFLRGNRALMRIAFATVFASPGELPPKLDYLEKAGRNYQFILSLIQNAVTRGELGTEFNADELTMGLLGMMNIYVMGFLVNPTMKLDAETARRVTALFLHGAQASGLLTIGP